MAKYEEARADLTELVKTYKDQKVAPNAYYALASAAEGMGDRRAALESFALLVSTYPRHPLSGFASLEAGRIYAENGDSLAALSSFAAARKFKEKAIFEPASVEGARLLEEMDQFDRALKWYNELLARQDIEIEPAFFEGAARASFYAGNFVETESIAARFEKNNKKSFSPEMAYYRTRAQLATEKFEEALAGADLLDRMDPGGEKGKYAPRLKGEALAALKRPREALSEFRRFASTAADSSAKVEALSRLADIYAADLADTTRALEVLMEKLDVEKRRVASDCISVASLYELVHDYKRARGLYEYVAKVFPFGEAADLAEERIKYIDAFAVIDEADALKRMEKAARDIISLPQSEGMLHLAAARMEILKDFEGALSLVDQALKSTGKSSVEAKGLYYKGACYALKANKSTASGDSSASASALKSACTVWGELASRFQKSSWAARAAYEKILVRFSVAGKVDTIEVFSTLAAYPSRSERAQAFEVLGDYYERLGGRGSMNRRVGYYRKALLVPDGLEEPASIRLRLADALMKTGDYEGSLEVSKSVLSEQKKIWHLRAAYLSASALRQMKKFAEAGKLFMEVSQGDPYGEMGARALLQAADCLYSRRRFDEAAKTYTAALDKASSSKLAWEITYRLSLCWDKMGETKDALDLLESCLNSKSGGKMRNRAYERAMKMAEALGDGDKERFYLERFVREFNKTPRARAAKEKLIRWYLANGLAPEALELSSDLSEGGTVEERNRAEAVRIMALFRTGRINEARDLEEKLRRRKIAPQLLWEMHLQAAWYYYDLRDYKSSLASSKTLVDECPKGMPCEEAVFYQDHEPVRTETDRTGRFKRQYFPRKISSRPVCCKSASQIRQRFGRAEPVFRGRTALFRSGGFLRGQLDCFRSAEERGGGLSKADQMEGGGQSLGANNRKVPVIFLYRQGIPEYS